MSTVFMSHYPKNHSIPPTSPTSGSMNPYFSGPVTNASSSYRTASALTPTNSSATSFISPTYTFPVYYPPSGYSQRQSYNSATYSLPNSNSNSYNPTISSTNAYSGQSPAHVYTNLPQNGSAPYQQLSTEQIYQLYSMRRSIPVQQQGQEVTVPGKAIPVHPGSSDRRSETQPEHSSMNSINSASSDLEDKQSNRVQAKPARSTSPIAVVVETSSPVGVSTPPQQHRSTAASEIGSNRLPPLSSLLSPAKASSTTSNSLHHSTQSTPYRHIPGGGYSQDLQKNQHHNSNPQPSPSEYRFTGYSNMENTESGSSYYEHNGSSPQANTSLSPHQRSSSTPVGTGSGRRTVKPKRKRATSFQVSKLNQVFSQTFFPSSELRLNLAMELGMTPRTVQIWFQNKRQGWRSEHNRSVPRDISMKPLKLSDVFPERAQDKKHAHMGLVPHLIYDQCTSASPSSIHHFQPHHHGQNIHQHSNLSQKTRQSSNISQNINHSNMMVHGIQMNIGPGLTNNVNMSHRQAIPPHLPLLPRPASHAKI